MTYGVTAVHNAKFFYHYLLPYTASASKQTPTPRSFYSRRHHLVLFKKIFNILQSRIMDIMRHDKALES